MLRDVLLGAKRLAITLLMLLAPAVPAGAVIISTSPDTANLKAPANDPGWYNVGTVGGGTGIYLGNRWVITANHVSGEYLRLEDGRVFFASVGSNRQLSNPGYAIGPDLRMFRLQSDPGLPSLEIASVSPPPGTQVMMIGSGIDRMGQMRGWNVIDTPLGYEWTETSLPNANVLGYSLGGDGPMRWGMNYTSSGSMFRPQDATQVFTTTFDASGDPFEAQATPGDSGGAVFIGGTWGWELAGVIITTQPLNNQPPDTVVFGQRTAIADLATYRDQILALLNRPDSLWQNQVNYFDVDGSGRLTAADCLSVINQLLLRGPSDLVGAPGPTDHWLDVTGDSRLNSSDILAVINELLRRNSLSASPKIAEPLVGMRPLPEPSSAALALLAVAGGWLWRHVSRRRAR
jgi:MYXO-CTERM domain-containing protein